MSARVWDCRRAAQRQRMAVKHFRRRWVLGLDQREYPLPAGWTDVGYLTDEAEAFSITNVRDEVHIWNAQSIAAALSSQDVVLHWQDPDLRTMREQERAQRILANYWVTGTLDPSAPEVAPETPGGQ